MIMTGNLHDCVIWLYYNMILTARSFSCYTAFCELDIYLRLGDCVFGSFGWLVVCLLILFKLLRTDCNAILWGRPYW